MPALPPVVSVIAPSGTGKTTLIEGVVAEFVRRGRRVGVLKHDAHRLALDRPGKDTWRYRRAGAWRAVIAGEREMAVFSAVEGELSLVGLVDAFLSDADLVITEGFRRSRLPALRVWRRARGEDPDWGCDNPLLAWVTDDPSSCPDPSLPVLPLDDPAAVADFLEERFLAGPAAVRTATGVVPVGPGADPDRVERVVGALRAACGGRVLAVLAPGARAPAGVPAVGDLRPGLGPLGALLTALAAVDTPHVLFAGLGGEPPPALLEGLLRWGPARADIVVPVRGGLPEPCMAVYGHRCLSAIQDALLGGEARMSGWWGAVRAHRVPEEVWRRADPEGRAFR